MNKRLNWKKGDVATAPDGVQRVRGSNFWALWPQGVEQWSEAVSNGVDDDTMDTLVKIGGWSVTEPDADDWTRNIGRLVSAVALSGQMVTGVLLEPTSYFQDPQVEYDIPQGSQRSVVEPATIRALLSEEEEWEQAELYDATHVLVGCAYLKISSQSYHEGYVDLLGTWKHKGALASLGCSLWKRRNDKKSTRRKK